MRNLAREHRKRRGGGECRRTIDQRWSSNQLKLNDHPFDLSGHNPNCMAGSFSSLTSSQQAATVPYPQATLGIAADSDCRLESLTDGCLSVTGSVRGAHWQMAVRKNATASLSGGSSCDAVPVSAVSPYSFCIHPRTAIPPDTTARGIKTVDTLRQCQFEGNQEISRESLSVLIRRRTNDQRPSPHTHSLPAAGSKQQTNNV